VNRFTDGRPKTTVKKTMKDVDVNVWNETTTITLIKIKNQL